MTTRRQLAAYWLATLFITLTGLAAGTLDILHAPPLYATLLHLGYPPYFATMLGSAKVLGALALLAPGTPRLKEWAYAGFFFDYVAALVSHLAMGDGAGVAMGPIVSAIAMTVSWALRPAERRLG